MQEAGQVYAHVHTLCEWWTLRLTREHESFLLYRSGSLMLPDFSIFFFKRSRNCKLFKCEITIFNGGYKKKFNSQETKEDTFAVQIQPIGHQFEISELQDVLMG